MDRSDLQRAPDEIVTPRVVLESPRAAHVRPVVDGINASLEILGFIDWGREPRDLAWGQRFVTRGAELVADGECLIYYVFERTSRAYVGRLDLHSFDWEAPRAEIGYVGDVRTAGRGLMREAALALVETAFSLGFARVHAISDARNTRALHFAQALGFVREAVLRHWERDVDGRLADQVMFAAYNPRAV